MIQIVSYVGDGNVSKVINLTPASGRFPLFALVMPVGSGNAIFRDPSHAGANSAVFADLSNTITGITAGAVDQITVGAALNSLGVTYSVFVIVGDENGWNNGNFVAPAVAAPDIWPPPPDPFSDLAILGSGGIVLNSGAPQLLVKDISGIYTIVPGKTDDTLYDRQTGITSLDVKIPDPSIKTGFIP
jgi:hypothetical protein